jgi:hypothetical protein
MRAKCDHGGGYALSISVEKKYARYNSGPVGQTVASDSNAAGDEQLLAG